MKQIWSTRAGGTQVLEIRTAPDPEPEEGEVAVSVHAIGINFADIMSRMGMYPDAPPFPFVAGYEVSGVVRACGAGVNEFSPGQRVFGMTRFGGYSTEVCVPKEQLFGIPPGLDFPEAASIPVNYFTAYLALFTMGSIRKGDRVLIHSAAGGVGTAAVDLARTVGVEIFGTASAGKHDYLREIGCDHPIDYRSGDFVNEVLRLTDGQGVQIVLDPIGGGNIRKDRRILSPLGKIIAYGVASASSSSRRQLLRLIFTAASFPFFHPVQLMNANQGILGLNLGRLWGEIGRLRTVAEEVLRLIDDGKIHPRARHQYPFDEVADAQNFIQTRRNTGKVILTVEH